MGTALENSLSEKRNAILGKWLDLIADTHPAGASFFKDKDRFTNPVGYTFSSAIGVLYDELRQGVINSEKVTQSLDDIIRIRAVQDFSPGEAVRFVLLLKQAIRDELKKQIREKPVREELSRFDLMIDELALRAFDVYSDCREKIYQIRLNEMRSAKDDAFRLLERITLKREQLEDGVATGYNGSEVT